jgi:predicted ester cyclase
VRSAMAAPGEASGQIAEAGTMGIAADLARRHIEAINDRRWDLDDEILARDLIGHHPLAGTIDGRDSYRATIEVILTMFPDVRVELHHVIGDDEIAAIRYTERGTHSGEHPALGPPTGRTYEKHGFGLYRQVGGQLVEFWMQENDLGFLHQLGLLDEPSVRLGFGVASTEGRG